MSSSTREKIVELITWSDGSISDSEIARILGVSRQAVHHHTRDMHIPRPDRKHRSCHGCKRRVSARNKSGMCRRCYVRTFDYVFTCLQCNKTHLLQGTAAVRRRNNDRSHPEGKGRRQFCDSICAGKYISHKAWADRKARNEKEVEQYKKERVQ